MTNSRLHQDKLLFARIADGDEDAFRELFHHYTALLLPFVRKLIHATEGQQEVIQESFLKIWQHRDKLPAVINPKAWIIRVVSNEATNYLQQLARQNRLTAKARESFSSDPMTPEQELAAKDMAILITKAVSRLSPGVRRVYQMSRDEHLSIHEIAAKLNVSENTIKNQLVTALKQIRRYLTDNGGATFLSVPFFF